MTTTDRIAGLNGSVGFKAPCRAATTAAITLSGEQTIDGIAIVANDRVLVKNQSSGVDNGIYLASTGAWSRALDFNGSRDARNGTLVYVTSGTTNSGDVFAMSATDPVTVGTTSLSFTAVLSLTAASAYIQTLLDDADAATAQTTLGGTTTGKALFTAASASDARTALGLGALATAATVSSAEITNGTIVNVDVSASAAIAATKLGGTGTPTSASQFLGGDDTWRDRLTAATAIASTSGTSIDFTSIPSWVKRITVLLSAVSTNGTSIPLIQIGTGGTPTTSGYIGASTQLAASSLGSTSTSAGVPIYGNNAGYALYGSLAITKVTGNTWVFSGVFTNTAVATLVIPSSGGVTLAGALDMVRLTTTNGTDTFDAGSVNVVYE